MYDRAKASYHRIASHVGTTADTYRFIADRLMLLPDHPLRDRALLRLADSLDAALALEEKSKTSRRRRGSDGLYALTDRPGPKGSNSDA